MSRIMFKGGAWTNKEDALLQAALAKYGMKNWDRVASMLENRKTTQQCKDRWFLYLDPAVSKGEWTTDEEEKLIRLQEAFPSQWELIASQISGRRAWQCEEHYRALVEASGGSSTTAPDALIAELRNKRAQGFGGTSMGATFDASFETRAPKADAVDHDHREEDMMATAIARLSNQDGKKQSREARQQQLKETSFLTTLQRGREMAESGTMSARMKKQQAEALKAATITGAETDDGDADEGYEEDEQGFTPIEVVQSAARHKKAAKLVSSKRAGDAGDEVETSGIDLSNLFSSSASAVPSSSLSGGLSLFDWSALEPAATSAQPQRREPPKRNAARVLARSGVGKEAYGDAVEAATEELLTSLAVDRDAYMEAVRLVEQEAKTFQKGEALVGAPLAIQRCIKQRLASSTAISAGDTWPHASTTFVSLEALASDAVAKAAARKRIRSEVCDGDELHNEHMRKELLAVNRASRALHFYKSICLPAEEAVMRQRLAECVDTLSEVQVREAALQQEYRAVF